jgi:putative aminopeptidase FrvX
MIISVRRGHGEPASAVVDVSVATDAIRLVTALLCNERNRMNETSKSFLLALLETASPSGYEEVAARRWRAEAEKFADEVNVDVNGSSYARLKGDSPRVVIEGHIDEIGLQVSHIDDEGYIWFRGIGGWDEQVLTGQHVRIVAQGGPIPGVIGRRPKHLLSEDEQTKASKIKDLWIDIGSKDGEETRSRVQIGDPVVLERPVSELANGIISGRGLDNRVGAFVALESLRQLSEDRPVADVYALAATQEEIGFRGARTSAFALEPDIVIVLDVTHATDHPNADKRSGGDIRVNSGPVVSRGSVVHPAVFRMLMEAANASGITVSIDAAPEASGTDADGIAPTRSGIPTGVVSFPCRYMHSPSELVSLSDLEQCATLLAEIVRRVEHGLDLRRL